MPSALTSFVEVVVPVVVSNILNFLPHFEECVLEDSFNKISPHPHPREAASQSWPWPPYASGF
jgi:hypothetical protein